MRSTLDSLRASLEESGGQVTADEMPTVVADPGQVEQLLTNLIGNAIKFRGAEAPRVHVAVARTGGMWAIAVRDNGIGIAPEYFERIFVIFQRLHSREEYPGTGVGLAICKKIVERHGGRIWVESAPGRGASFSFTLPAATE
jgi:light-regulated signal transduction histidine kinase (bacteriophytochrome)